MTEQEQADAIYESMITAIKKVARPNLLYRIAKEVSLVAVDNIIDVEPDNPTNEKSYHELLSDRQDEALIFWKGVKEKLQDK